MDIETPARTPGDDPPSDGYATVLRLALTGAPDASLELCRRLDDAEGLELLARVLLGRHHTPVRFGPLPRIPLLDESAQRDLAYRLVAAAHLERDKFLSDSERVAASILQQLLPRELHGLHCEMLQRRGTERYSPHRGDDPDLSGWLGEWLGLPPPLAEKTVACLRSHGRSASDIREAAERVRLAPALNHLNLAAGIVERLGLEALAEHLLRDFHYPPEIDCPEPHDLPLEERYDLLFEPSLFDREVRAARDQELWLLLHADGLLDHPVVRARRAEFLIWAEEDDDALALVDGVEHPLAQAMYVKVLVNIVRDSGGYPESLYRDARTIANRFREYTRSSDPLVREAGMHMLEMLGAIAYYFDEDPETANFYATRSLHIADELMMTDKTVALESQLAATRNALGRPQPRSSEPVPLSNDPRRQELHAVVRLKTALRQREHRRACEIAESHFGSSHIPLLVKAWCRYSELDYWGVGALVHEAENFRADFHVFKALLTLQTFARVGEVAYANPERALDSFEHYLAGLSAPFEVLADARRVFPLGLLLAAAHDSARGDVRREAELVPIMRLSTSGRSGSWCRGDLVAVVPPGVAEDIYAGEAQGDRPIEYFTGLARQRNPFSNKDDLRRVRVRHERAGLDWRSCIPEITLFRALKRFERHLPGAGFGRAAAEIEAASPELLAYLS